MRNRGAARGRSVAISEGRLKYERTLPEDGGMQDVAMDFLKARLKPNPAWRERVDRRGERSPPC